MADENLPTGRAEIGAHALAGVGGLGNFRIGGSLERPDRDARAADDGGELRRAARPENFADARDGIGFAIGSHGHAGSECGFRDDLDAGLGRGNGQRAPDEIQDIREQKQQNQVFHQRSSSSCARPCNTRCGRWAGWPSSAVRMRAASPPVKTRVAL